MSAQSDPFAQYRIKKPQVESKQDIPVQKDQFSQYRIKKAEGFPFLAEAGRHTARTASRIAETIGGIPGDISSLIQSGVFAGLENLVGIPTSEKAREKVKEQRLPSSEELQKTSEKITGGLTKAQGGIEKTIDEFVKTASSLVGPMKFRKALGVGLGSEIAKKGLEVSGFGKGAQESGKLGTMFMLSMINPKGALKYAASQYDKASQLSKGASIIAKDLESNLTNLRNDLQQGVTTAAKNVVLKPTEELLTKIQNGKIPVQELTAAKRDINTLMGDPALLKRERNLLKVLAQNVDKAIKPYEKINPAFGKAYRPANEIYGAVMQGNKASNFVKKVLGAKSILGATIAETALGHPEYILPTAGAAAAAVGSAKTVDFITRLAKSKELQKFYKKALVSAAKEDASALRLYEKEIEDILKKD